MQESTIEEFDAPEGDPSRKMGIRGILSTMVGAVIAVAVLLTMGVWFYRLGVRDAQNVPIIRAALEPVKVRPEDPGGTETPHQDITSYQVAESEPAQASAALIAPAPPEPRPEDIAMGALPETAPPAPSVAAQPDEQQTEIAAVATASPEIQTDALQTDAEPTGDLQAEIDRQVAVVLSESATPPTRPAAIIREAPVASETAPAQSEVPQTELAAVTNPEPQPAEEPEVAPEEPEVTSGSDLAPGRSPAAPRRPKNLLARVEDAKQEDRDAASDLASRAANSSVQVQLAADPSESAIRQQWRRIQAANADILHDRTLAVQSTVSGGTTFYRLRVGPFRNAAEARAVCQALKARGQDCIVARNS